MMIIFHLIISHSCLAITDSDIVDDIYGNLIRKKRYEQLANSAILSARNLGVGEKNIPESSFSRMSFFRIAV